MPRQAEAINPAIFCLDVLVTVLLDLPLLGINFRNLSSVSFLEKFIDVFEDDRQQVRWMGFRVERFPGL